MTWMLAIVRHKATDAYRAHRVRLSACDDSGLDEDAAWDSAPSPCVQMELQQASQQLRRCMATLVEPRRAAIELAFLHGLTHDEVASRLDKPLGTVKTWIRRGVVDLRRQMRSLPPA